MRLSRRPFVAAGLGWLCHARAADAEHPLKGQSIELVISGLADRPPSRIAAEMAPAFAAYARERHGYDVSIRFDPAPVAALFERTESAFAAKTAMPSLLIIQNEWLDAFASPKWIVPLNPLIQANPELDLEWYAPSTKSAHQLSPADSNNRWAMPQSGDALALYIRRDLLIASGEAAAFHKKHGMDLPQSWEDFEKLTWADYTKLLDFFTRRENNLYGLGSHWSAAGDSVSCPAISFILGAGGEIWRPKAGQVAGVLDTDANAAAIAAYKALLAYQPGDALGYDAAGLTAAFTEGKLFSALQWCSAGPDMIPAAMRDKILVVPPPTFPDPAGKPNRRYVVGGQGWALNAFADDPQRLVALDVLKWWFQPATTLEFARRGGNPCDRRTLDASGFDDLQPWFRTYRTMLHSDAVLWRDPQFHELLAISQEALAAYMAGRVADPRHALDDIACRQQALLFDQGTAERQPDPACRAMRL